MSTNQEEPQGHKRRGFALLSQERQRELASLGGKRAQALGTAHRFTAEEARGAGKVGGKVAHSLGRAHEFTAEEGRAAALKGVEVAAARRAATKAKPQEPSRAPGERPG